MYAKKNSTKKLVATLLALVLLIGCTIGGTLAWLAAKTDPVVNTFTVGDITLELTETFNKTTGTATAPDAWEGKIVPGKTEGKDPTVTVGANSENCWVFVKVEESDNLARAASSGVTALKYVNWGINTEKWQAVPNVSGVYYLKCTTSNADQVYPVLAGNEVSYSSELSATMLENMTGTPTLTITAYAIQSDYLINGTDTEIDAKDAWDLLTAQIATDTP